MKRSTVAIALSIPLALVYIQACGDSGDSNSASDPSLVSTASTIDDASAPTTATVEGAVVVVAGGALATGSKLNLSSSSRSISAAPAIVGSPVSRSLTLAATSSSGAAVNAFTVPVAVAINFEPAATTLGLEDTTTDVCVLGVAADSTKLIWRRNALANIDEEAGELTINTKWLGTFQAFYCGAENLEGFNEVNLTGDKAIEAGAGMFAAATCDYTAVAEIGYCTQYFGKGYLETQTMGSIKATCDNWKGVWTLDSTCPSENLLGTCVTAKGTTFEFGFQYYTTSAISSSSTGKLSLTADPITADDAKAYCESMSYAWYPAGKFTPTAADKQTAAQSQGTSSGSVSVGEESGSSGASASGSLWKRN